MTEGERSNLSSTSKKTQEDAVKAFQLRPERLPVTRLSRKALISGAAFMLFVVSGTILWSLKKNTPRTPSPSELYATEHNHITDGLASLPKDYAGMPRDVPKLGPPLPGDLGRPIVAAQGQTGSIALDAEQQRANQESEAARTSKVFASTNVRPPAATSQTNDATTSTPASTDEAFAQNGQDRKLAFVNASVDRRTTSSDRLAKPASPHVIQASTVIPAALITGIRSDLPGQMTAQVTENVYDTPTGRFLLIPQGSRLIGTYDSQVAHGQSRVLLVWTRLILPNGRSIVLERLSGADAAGYSGLQDQVDNHWKELVGAAALSTLLAVGTEANAGSDANSTNAAIVRALRRGEGQSSSQVGHLAVRRGVNIQPTLTVRAGFPLKVIVSRDLVIDLYRG